MSVVPEVLFDRMRAAEDRVLRNELGLVAHEKECALRYGHINHNVEGLRRDFRNVAICGAGIALTVIGFLIKITFFAPA